MVTARGTAGTVPAPQLDRNATGPAPDSVGLSTGHKSPYARPHPRWTDRAVPITFHLRYSPEGRLVQTRAEFGPLVNPPTWRRGIIPGLSRKSRARLVKLLASIRWEKLTTRPIFLTLTYPETWPADWTRWKDQFEAFWKRLKRGWTYRDHKGQLVTVHYPHASCIWRIEMQERGAPHFHLILFGVRWVDIPWLDKAWSEVVKSADPKHINAGTRVEWPKGWKNTVAYVAKYVAKQTPTKARKGWDAATDAWAEVDLAAIGRHWGACGRKDLPISLDELEIDAETFELVKAVLIDARDDDKGHQFLRAPFRGLWGVCGPGLIRPILAAAGLIGYEAIN